MRLRLTRPRTVRAWFTLLAIVTGKALRRFVNLHQSVRAVRSAVGGLGRRRLMRAAVALIVVPLLVVTGLSAAAMHWTSQPSFCARCHVMQPYIDGWAAGAHGSVNCEDCHLPPGGVAFVGGKIAAMQVVVDYFRGDYRDQSFNAVVGNASCLKCHADIESAVLVRDGIKVAHAGIVRLGAKCMSCHSTIAHGDATPVGSRTYPTMNTCFSCHDGKIASTTCTTCHVTGDWRLPPKVPGVPGTGG